jgi:hypothetical protein
VVLLALRDKRGDTDCMHRSRWAVAAVAVPVLAALAACSASHGAGPVSAASDLPALTAPSSAAGAVHPAATSPAPTATVMGFPPIISKPPAPPACTVLPADNIWHAPVTGLPVDAHSAAYVKSIGATSKVHPDFGSGTYDGAPFGIPITRIPAGQAKVKVKFSYASESDKGPYAVPSNALIEGGAASTGDRHVIVVDQTNCVDYELYDAHRSGSTWTAGSGAIYNLRSDALRPKGWTSADAAGLPILAGLVQYGEVASGHIDHAIRMTVPSSQTAYVWPARHQAGSSSSSSLPPMGARFRLKASVDISHLPAQARVVAQALKTYGAIVADNGSAWYLSGTQDSRWDNDALHALGTLPGSDFEAVDASSLMISVNSGAAR